MLQVVPLSPPEDEGAIALEDLEDLDKQSGSQEAQCARLSSALRSAPDFEVKEEKEGSDASSDARSQSLSPEGVSWRLKIPALICVLLFTRECTLSATVYRKRSQSQNLSHSASRVELGRVHSRPVEIDHSCRIGRLQCAVRRHRISQQPCEHSNTVGQTFVAHAV